MSTNKISAENQNLQLLRKIADKLLKHTPPSNASSTNIAALVDLVVQQELEQLQLATFLTKIESEIEINLTADDSQHLQSTKDDLWIFGYGSLVWKADFPYASRRIGFIKGFERRFYQNSIDHRGTAEYPGRVVTLIPSSNPNSKVWGVAYRIATSDRENVLKHLDFREKNGYERLSVNFYPYSPDNGASFSEQEIVVYIATAENESYAGHINDLEKIAEQIYTAKGPSGTNREYVYKLANAMRMLFPGERDDHLFALESRLREREQRELKMNRQLKDDITEIIQQAVDSSLHLENIELSIRNKMNEFHGNMMNS